MQLSGYFLVYHATLLSRIDLPAQLWKEYAISDSRYLSGDTFVLAIERITVVRVNPSRPGGDTFEL